MSVELTISGIACNLKCPYCYQNDMRAAHNVTSVWNWEAIQKALLYENQGFTVFGGEPLTAPIERLEQVFAFELKHYGHNGIQTNGALITSEHLSLFETYQSMSDSPRMDPRSFRILNGLAHLRRPELHLRLPKQISKHVSLVRFLVQLSLRSELVIAPTRDSSS